MTYVLFNLSAYISLLHYSVIHKLLFYPGKLIGLLSSKMSVFLQNEAFYGG